MDNYKHIRVLHKVLSRKNSKMRFLWHCDYGKIDRDTLNSNPDNINIVAVPPRCTKQTDVKCELVKGEEHRKHQTIFFF